MERNAADHHAPQQQLLAALSSTLPSFQRREAQLQLMNTALDALAVPGMHALTTEGVFGKSFALLLAAACCGQAVVISVGSVALQHKLQLDWAVLKAAGITTRTLALHSSRRNQLCPQRLAQQCQRRDVGGKAQALMQWHRQTGSRELSLCPLLPEDDPLLARICCTGTRCEPAPCASTEHHAADIVVVTHAWLLAQKQLPRFIGMRRLLVDDAEGMCEATREHGVQTLDLAFWAGQRSAFETWLARHLALESDLLRPYLQHLCALMRRIDDSDVIDPLLVALREAVEVFLKSFTQLCEARGIRSTEPSPWLDYCDFYRRWFEAYNRRDNPLYTIARKHEREGAGWVCRIENASATSSITGLLQQFAVAVLVFAQAEVPTLLAPLQPTICAIAAAASARYVPHVAPLDGLTADIGEVQRLQRVAECLRGNIARNPSRWLLLVTQRAQVDRYRAVLADRSDVLFQGDQAKTVLLKRFSAASSGILVATWQMVDGWDFGDAGVAGAVLDRLPVLVPRDGGNATSRDRNAFVESVIPRAQKILRRIAAMLIRREHQQAQLLIADPRLLTHAWADTIAAAFDGENPDLRQLR